MIKHLFIEVLGCELEAKFYNPVKGIVELSLTIPWGDNPELIHIENLVDFWKGNLFFLWCATKKDILNFKKILIRNNMEIGFLPDMECSYECFINECFIDEIIDSPYLPVRGENEHYSEHLIKIFERIKLFPERL